MRKYYFLFLLSLTIIVSKAQSVSSEQIFSNVHGIREALNMSRSTTTYYEVEGYSIYVGNTVASLDEKGLQKIKRKFKIDDNISEIKDPEFANSKILLQVKALTPIVNQTKIYYLSQIENNVNVVLLTTFSTRDEELEKFMFRAILNDKIPNEVYTSNQVDSINFAGRIIKLGSACDWMGAHNVQCPNLGQMNWAEFRNAERAEEMIKNQLLITKSKSIGTAVKEDLINVVFEGQETKAVRLTYKLKIPKVVTGGSNVLIVYYVAAKVRGKHVACVLSHYTDEAKENTLPKLLAEVMRLK